MNLARISICLAALPLAYAQPDPKALFLRSIENYQRDWRAGMNWAYTQRDVTRGDGTEEVDVSEVIPLEGTPYDRLILKDSRPLTPDERLKEDRKFEKTSRERRNESPAERQARIAKYENERSFLNDLPNAYDFRVLGDEVVDARSAWILGLTPRADFAPTTLHGAMLKHIEGKLWIDKRDVQWARAEASVIEPIGIGWILARIGAGARIKLDMTPVVDGLWMPEKIDINGIARVLMVHTRVLDEHLSFSGYHPRDAAPVSGVAKIPPPGRSYR